MMECGDQNPHAGGNMRIAVRLAAASEKCILQRLLELNAHDWSEFDQADVDPSGVYGYPYFESYWEEPGRNPFFIMDQERYVGFVLVNRHCIVLKDRDAHSIAEFFVLRKYRRQGVGRMAAELVFDKFPGQWEVIQHRNNPPSILFWESVIGRYSAGNYSKQRVATEEWDGQALIFSNA